MAFCNNIFSFNLESCFLCLDAFPTEKIASSCSLNLNQFYLCKRSKMNHPFSLDLGGLQSNERTNDQRDQIWRNFDTLVKFKSFWQSFLSIRLVFDKILNLLRKIYFTILQIFMPVKIAKIKQIMWKFGHNASDLRN